MDRESDSLLVLLVLLPPLALPLTRPPRPVMAPSLLQLGSSLKAASKKAAAIHLCSLADSPEDVPPGT